MRRNHGGGIVEEKSWRRNLGRVIMEASGRHLGGIWRHLGGTLEVSTLGFPPLPETSTRKDMKAEVC